MIILHHGPSVGVLKQTKCVYRFVKELKIKPCGLGSRIRDVEAFVLCDCV